MARKILLLTTTVFTFFSCSSSFMLTQHNKPSWLTSLDGYLDGSLVTTGCANIHVRGFDAQKKLAIQRAVEKLSMQKSTIVSTTSTKSEKRNNGRLSYSKHKNNSTYKSNSKISFKIKEFYFDEKNKIYCVLVKE